jgi:hypothetical protein
MSTTTGHFDAFRSRSSYDEASHLNPPPVI